jgi:GNAT superfamily N-acetyltransferase
MTIQESVAKFKADFSKIVEVSEDKLNIKIYENSSGVQFTLEEFVNQYNPEDIQKGQANFIFAINIGQKPMARFILQDMVNCSGIIINSDVFVSKLYQNKGLGSLLNKFCIDFCKHYGYGIIQSTDKDMNEYQKRIFTKNNWKLVADFINPKTLNRINVWMYFLN